MFRSLILLTFFITILAGCSENEQAADKNEDVSVAEQAVLEKEMPAAPVAQDTPPEMNTPPEAEQAPQTPAELSEAYLFINAQKPGVQVTASGLQFEILKSGSGRSPGPASLVQTHYHGMLVDGEVFDSSVDRGQPASFPVNRVIQGWQEALPMMKEGDLWRLVIPSELAYGERGAAGGQIPPNAALIFEVELIKVLSDG